MDKTYDMTSYEDSANTLMEQVTAEDTLFFLCPRHKMAEGHIEFTLSVCVCLCIPKSCPGHNLAVHDGI